MEVKRTSFGFQPNGAFDPQQTFACKVETSDPVTKDEVNSARSARFGSRSLAAADTPIAFFYQTTDQPP